MSSNKPTDWGAQFKTAIAASGRSVNELAKASGIAQPILQRFVSGTQDSIRLDTANKLGDVLGLRLVATAKAVAGSPASGNAASEKTTKRRRPTKASRPTE